MSDEYSIDEAIRIYQDLIYLQKFGRWPKNDIPPSWSVKMAKALKTTTSSSAVINLATRKCANIFYKNLIGLL